MHVLNEHTPLTPDGRLVPPRPHQRALTRLVARRVDGVVAVTRRQVPPLEALGYPRGRIDVVPNGVFERDVQGVEASPELDGRVLGAVRGGTPAGEAGGPVHRGGGRRAAREPGDPRLRGRRGPERERLERLADGNGVTLLGVRRDVLELIRAADAVCLPSEAEALPMSILEAMALERPVVATDVGGTAEQVVDGETGHLVPAGDPEPVRRALLALAADPERAREMGAAGRRRQRERFSGRGDGRRLRARVRGGGRAVARPDVLLVSLGTTLGWRRGRRDAARAAAAGRARPPPWCPSAGAPPTACGAAIRSTTWSRCTRRGARCAPPSSATSHAALIVSSTTAAMLLPSLPVPYAVRFDSPAAAEPAGRAQRAPARARAARHAARADHDPVQRGRSGGAAGGRRAADRRLAADRSSASHDSVERAERERVAVAYVPDPKAKGLDVLVAGWAAAAVPDARLEVYGLDPEWARSHLRRSGVPEPASLDLHGTVAADQFRARLRHARAYLAGARWEDWGQAPLEALADGALLATVPSGGPYEGLRLARRLDASLVADEIDAAALAPAIRAAFEMPDERASAYREQSRRAAAPIPLGGGAGDRDPRAAAGALLG